MDIKRVGKILKAFSVIELTISVVVISCVIAAFAPVMSKRISTQDIIAGDAQCILSECEDIIKDNEGNTTGCTLCDKCKKECIECPKICGDNGEYKHEAKCTCESCSSAIDTCISCHWDYKVAHAQCDQCQSGYYLELDKQDGIFKCYECHIGHRCKGGPRTDTENGEVECLPDSSNQQYQDKTTQSSCSSCHDAHNCLTCKTIANLGEACANKTNCASSEYCKTCTANHYLKKIGTADDDYECAECPTSPLTSTSNNESSTSCDCPTNSHWVTDPDKCVCNSDSYLSNGSCIKCVDGSTPKTDKTGCICSGTNKVWTNSNTCVCDSNSGYNTKSDGTCVKCGSNQEWDSTNKVCKDKPQQSSGGGGDWSGAGSCSNIYTGRCLHSSGNYGSRYCTAVWNSCCTTNSAGGCVSGCCQATSNCWCH